MTRVVVFGAGGFIGRNFINSLKSYEVAGYDIVLDSPALLGDKTDPTLVAGADVVVDLAAMSLAHSREHPRENARANIMNTLALMDNCLVHGVKKFIFTSASSVVGDAAEGRVPEDVKCNPKTPYAQAKLTVEGYARLYKELKGLDYTIFRLFNVYGPGQVNGLVPSLANKIKADQPVTIFGTGDSTRDFIYVGDVCQFLEKAIVTNAPGVYNLGTGKPTTILRVAELTAEILEKKLIVNHQPEQPGELKNFYADTTKLENTFKTVPSTPLEDGLHKTLEASK